MVCGVKFCHCLHYSKFWACVIKLNVFTGVNGEMGRRMKEIEKANGDLGARLGDAESQLSSSLTEIRTLTENVCVEKVMHSGTFYAVLLPLTAQDNSKL